MRKTFKLAVLAAALSAGLGTVGSAGAAPSPTPTGYTGALNMLQDSSMVSVPMANDSAQGNAGMFHATCVTADFGC